VVVGVAYDGHRNFAALSQTNIKRLLAYSSIAHAGYVMVAIASHSSIGVAAAMFYLAAYALMNIGAFAVITHFSRQGESSWKSKIWRVWAGSNRSPRLCSRSFCCR